MADRILTPEEISALTEGTTEGPWAADGFAGVFAPSDPEKPLGLMAHLHGTSMEADGRLIAAAPDLARTALAAMAVARRLADGWVRALGGTYWVRVNDDAEWIAEPMTPDESAFWAALEGDSHV